MIPSLKLTSVFVFALLATSVVVVQGAPADRGKGKMPEELTNPANSDKVKAAQQSGGNFVLSLDGKVAPLAERTIRESVERKAAQDKGKATQGKQGPKK